MGLLDKILTEHTKLLESAMRLSSHRQKIIASNLANLETPGYRAKDFKFMDILQAEMHEDVDSLMTTHEEHISESKILRTSTPVEDHIGPEKPDGNNVDLDIEMARLNYTKGYFQNASYFLKAKYQMMINILKGF
ncbi:MAG: flagellar basal body rod protein FlgB [Deltaproteobacteria bacterium]|nr:flagellar basal body rod protein FlgB [Deltaproteobacteria bacterium]